MNASSATLETTGERVSGRKECQVLAAARQEFLQLGFAGTSMDGIARSAGVSKATLYAYFPSKEALFTHLIEAECKNKCGSIPSPDLDLGLAPALRVVCRHFVDFFLSPESAAFFQTVSNERGRFPELCRLYFNSGKQTVDDFLSAYLAQARDRGLLSFEDSNIAAEQLLNLAVADLPLRVALGLELRGEAEAEKIMEAGIATFLKAYGMPPGSPA